MSEVGVRDLRNHLSRYLDVVRAGEELLVTDRGTAIARIIPLHGERALDRLIRDGLVTPASSTKRHHPTPIAAAGSVSDLVADQRR